MKAPVVFVRLGSCSANTYTVAYMLNWNIIYNTNIQYPVKISADVWHYVL